MGAEEPRWYYVGNGQLRLKEGENWTDQYQKIETRRAAVPSQVLGAESVPKETLPVAGSSSRTLLWLVACAVLVVVVGTGAAAAKGSLNLGGLQSTVSASKPKAVTGSATGADSTTWDGGGYTKADLSLIHISEPTRRTPISYAVFCLKKKKKKTNTTQQITNHQ